MNNDNLLLTEAARANWWAYITTHDGDLEHSGRLTYTAGRATFADGHHVNLIDATRTAGGTIVGLVGDGHEIVIRPTPRPAPNTQMVDQ